MQKYDRRSQSPTRDEVAELVAVTDPTPPELPEEVVDLLRRARQHCKDIARAVPYNKYDCIMYKCGNFEDEIDELLQKYCYSMPEGRFDYWQSEWFREEYC
ncbi:MAG: hypothetical protein NT123_24795 [Proteobacteria bacterium]|nr:hypothetical protein [Pseudomonadota bacterium]